jgi:hypothetical protein
MPVPKNTGTVGFGRKKTKTVFGKPKKTEIVFIPTYNRLRKQRAPGSAVPCGDDLTIPDAWR